MGSTQAVSFVGQNSDSEESKVGREAITRYRLRAIDPGTRASKDHSPRLLTQTTHASSRRRLHRHLNPMGQAPWQTENHASAKEGQRWRGREAHVLPASRGVVITSPAPRPASNLFSPGPRHAPLPPPLHPTVLSARRFARNSSPVWFQPGIIAAARHVRHPLYHACHGVP